jgi:predicted nucleotidyltransferase
MEAKNLSAAIDPATVEALRLFTERITAKYDVLDLMLFGSRARGDHARDSDADVAVLLRGGHQRLLPTKLAMADEAFDVMLETGVRIQPLPIWEDEWADPEHYVNSRLLRNITREEAAYWLSRATSFGPSANRWALSGLRIMLGGHSKDPEIAGMLERLRSR